MRKLVARLAVAASLAAFAVPALACDAMKNTHASTAQPQTQEKAEKRSEKKAEAKTEAKKEQPKVASADKK